METPTTPETWALVAALDNLPAQNYQEAAEAKFIDFAERLERERDSARELLREIRDNEVNPQDEADKFLRDGVCSELSKSLEYIDELEGRSVHSCGDHCQRPACVKRHEREAEITRLKQELQEAREDAERLADLIQSSIHPINSIIEDSRGMLRLIVQKSRVDEALSAHEALARQ